MKSQCMSLAALLCTAAVSHAEIADTGQGVFGGTMTVQGVDGNTYSLRTSSGIYMENGCIRFGDTTQQCTKGGGSDVVSSQSNTFNGPGTVQTFQSSVTFNGRVSFSPSQSTATFVNISWSYSQGATCLSPCVTGTTLTWVSDGTPVYVEFNGTVDDDNQARVVMLGFLIDGAYPAADTANGVPALSCHVGAGVATILGTQMPANGTFSYPITPSAGSHTVCLTAADYYSSSHTLRFGQASSTYTNQALAVFRVRPQR